ncbi:MAG: carboxypeptidase-like regulatory domain-containing protein [Flavobacteriales bacterium]|nr:carboxypeptidase-like regulatory domain-containing protein [Flavobacteriales bacterium]
MKQYIFITLFLFGFTLKSVAQTAKKNDSTNMELVQFSGVVMTSDSLVGIPYAAVAIQRSHAGTYTDVFGYFTLVARKGDTLNFSCIGFRPNKYVIPDTFSDFKYSMIILLTADTMHLPTVVVRPMPRRELFDYYFVKSDIPDDDLERARKNLEREELKESREILKPDGIEVSKLHLSQQTQKYYYAGQVAPNNLLNPFAWAQFFEAWKRGDFKREVKTSDE